MTTQKFEEKQDNKLGSITISIGKKGDVGGEFTVKMLENEPQQIFEDRYNYFKNKLLQEVK